MNNAPASPELLRAMTDALAHRGPDGSGCELFGAVGMGHRRLSIIDLEGGKQPLANEDGSVWITFNGEIYNYRELREELEAKGHQFRTNSDTESIIHAYEEWGDQCVERFRGMFAFCILDQQRERLFLARDQFGIKPLFFLHSPHYFAFSSELQALRILPGEEFELDLQAIDQYLWLQYIPAPRTVFKQVWKLPPAHRMSISLDGMMHEPEEYWRVDFRPNHTRSEAECLEALDAVLRDSVRAHLVSDVPFGAFLSGGVDSSCVVAYMSQLLSQPVQTFTIGFEEEEFSEIPYAEEAARRCHTDHHVEIIKPNAMEILPSLVRHYGEPFGDSSAIPTYYVCKMARGAVPMVLSGDGGDETFAGYNSYKRWLEWLHYSKTKSWKKLAIPFAQLLLPHRHPKREPTLRNWLSFINYISPEKRDVLWRPEYRQLSTMPLETFEREFARTAEYSFCEKVQYMDIKTYLPYDILTKVDIASMMHGLEVRTPLVDVRVAEFAATLPDAMKMRRGRDGAWDGKYALKKVMSRYFPESFIQRPKKGFAVPIQRWFEPDGALYEMLSDKLLAPESMLHEYFVPATMQQMISANATGPLWLLLFLEEWLQQNKKIPALRKA